MAMVGTGSGAGTRRRTPNKSNCSGREGGDEGGFARFFSRVARLLLGLLQLGISLIDALLGIALRQAGALHHDAHQHVPIGFGELAALQ